MKSTVKKILCFFLCFTMCFSFAACSGTDYKNAVTLMNEGEYEQAVKIFEGLSDYKDSKENISECNYQLGCKEVENHNYSAASDIFSSLGDYKDSSLLYKQCSTAFTPEIIHARAISEYNKNTNSGSLRFSQSDNSDCIYNVIISGQRFGSTCYGYYNNSTGEMGNEGIYNGLLYTNLIDDSDDLELALLSFFCIPPLLMCGIDDNLDYNEAYSIAIPFTKEALNNADTVYHFNYNDYNYKVVVGILSNSMTFNFQAYANDITKY